MASRWQIFFSFLIIFLGARQLALEGCILYFLVAGNIPFLTECPQLSHFIIKDCFIILEEGMATHSSILAWRIPCTEEPGGLQSLGPESLTLLK